MERDEIVELLNCLKNAVIANKQEKELVNKILRILQKKYPEEFN